MWTTEIISIVLWLTIAIGAAIAIALGTVIWAKKSGRKKVLRYFRWSIKAAFLLVFMIPVAYLIGAADAPVYSYLSDGLSNSFLSLPIGQSPDVIWLVSFGLKASGARVVCPVWAVPAIVASQVDIVDLIPTIVALLLFLIPILIVGNMFCGWVCPLGSIIDSFDGFVRRFFPKLEAKRVERQEKDKELRAVRQSQSTNIICPSCPIGRLSGRYGLVANGLLLSSIVGSAVLKFPVFCAVCPIGISTRGVAHLSSIASVTGKFLPLIIELWAIPVIAVLTSLREKRFWCKKLCPVGAILNLTGAFSPLFKPAVNVDKCRLEGCPEDCEDYKLDYCFMCRQTDQKQCEKVCPLDINLTDKESLSRCTKCFECYINCESNAMEIKLTGTPDAKRALDRFFKRKRAPNPETLAVFNEITTKSGIKLTKLKLNLQEFDLSQVTENNINCFVVRSIERTENLDRYYATNISQERIIAKNKMQSEYAEIPVSSVVHGLRSYCSINTIDVSDREDFIISSEFRDVNKVCPGIAEKTMKNWKDRVTEKAANLLVAKRIDVPSDLPALAVYSNNPIVGTGMWSVAGLQKEEAKLQALWFNSAPNLLQIHLLRTSRTLMKLKDYKLAELSFLNIDSLSQTQREELMNLFKEIGPAELPSIMEQLEYRNPLRLKLDMTILKILGYSELEATKTVNNLYPLLIEETKRLAV